MKRDTLLFIEDHDEIQECIEEIKNEFDWLNKKWEFCNNSIEGASYISSNHASIFGIISDVWIYKTKTSQRPDPQNSKSDPAILHILRTMQQQGISNVPVFIYSRYFNNAGDGRTSSVIKDAETKYDFIVKSVRLEFATELMIKDAIKSFNEFHTQ
ncbi:hypothetical protein Enr10x_19140 [Gimesia panareensis]|uniref:Uncharacterized protein n=1 Tax=Gimesia panareensis TaxID=2527978 RepID=A0A517Q4Q4_9PLAN|nr:hypothetical protein [Gimesia panareensis]QDT26610.1 hypothetical protein Enr10x_19140 [Gimesia panareensis]